MQITGPSNQHTASSDVAGALSGSHHRMDKGSNGARSPHNSIPQHVPSREATEFTQQVHELPEVRADVVAAAKTRLANGEYFTRAAAEQTAAALVNNP